MKTEDDEYAGMTDDQLLALHAELVATGKDLGMAGSDVASRKYFINHQEGIDSCNRLKRAIDEHRSRVVPQPAVPRKTKDDDVKTSAPKAPPATETRAERQAKIAADRAAAKKAKAAVDPVEPRKVPKKAAKPGKKAAAPKKAVAKPAEPKKAPKKAPKAAKPHAKAPVTLKTIAPAKKLKTLTMKEAVVRILHRTQKPMRALDILAELNRRHRIDFPRTSLSPQLSRLRQENVLTVKDGDWRLIANRGKKYLAEAA